eukprot:TRINITY_DN1741_c0_g1_i4.p1 TRINITY_DN1741_c0_g1~~TRINITY_DN1741_c0_g1_i4.p1  ORF type:complete len:529 (+),score=181.78 TRINITY_DN1741_c0_g1_i4:472-2058(+)
MKEMAKNAAASKSASFDSPKKAAVVTLGAPVSNKNTPSKSISFDTGKFEEKSEESAKPKALTEVLKKDEPSVYSPKTQLHRQMTQNRRKEIEAMMSSKVKKEHLNLVVIGHVDAGKSTIMGHLLYLFGVINQKVIHKYEKESKNMGKGSFSFAWVLDENEEERNRGVTMDVGITNFETPNRRVTLLDAPGHRDFVPNMISGTAQADVGLLVVDAAPDGFEKGFEADGQTKEHALLARSLGISQLGVVINKLDLADWSKQRYDDIVGKMTAFLKLSGFREKSFWFIPLSGFAGENIVARKEEKLTSWYSGPTLAERIDQFDPAVREISKPFRLCISDMYKAQVLGLAAAGRVEAGLVSVGDKLLVSPGNEICTVKGIKIHGESVEYATAGDYVDLGLSGVDGQLINNGNVLCDPEKAIPVSNRFRAQILTFTLQRPILKGQSAEMHYTSQNEAAVITHLISILDKSSGEVKKKTPRALGEHMTAVVEIKLYKPLCLELYADYKQLGRFTLRENGKTFAAGIITEILPSK